MTPRLGSLICNAARRLLCPLATALVCEWSATFAMAWKVFVAQLTTKLAKTF
jgi:hypothetical protein